MVLRQEEQGREQELAGLAVHFICMINMRLIFKKLLWDHIGHGSNIGLRKGSSLMIQIASIG